MPETIASDLHTDAGEAIVGLADLGTLTEDEAQAVAAYYAGLASSLASR